MQQLLANHPSCSRSLVILAGRGPTGAWRELGRSGLPDASVLRPIAPDSNPAAPMFGGVLEADVNTMASAMDSVAAGSGRWMGSVRMARGKGAVDWVTVDVCVDTCPVASREEMPLCMVVASLQERDPGTEIPIARSAESRDTVLQAAGIGIIEYDASARSVHLDAEAAAHHGMEPLLDEALPADMWVGRFKREDQLTIYALLISGVAVGQTERITVRMPTVDPRKHRVLELAFRVRPSDHRLMGVSRDVTAERSLEELKRQKLAAERASQAKTDFMSQVSHELRTPLNAVLGFAQLMESDADNPLPAAHLERLAVLQHSGRRLLGLIDQLLQIGRIEQGKRRLSSKAVKVQPLVKHCVDALQVAAHDRRIDIEIDMEQSRAVSVRADPDALEQVLTNLLSNAIKYNREQGRVRIGFRAGELGEITLEDTGKGLSDSQLGQLFEPFNRLGAGGSGIQGTGLGLVITRKLVQAMGGKLDVWSQVGKGTRFTIHLPLARHSRQHGSAEPETLPLDLPTQRDKGRRRKVLYVEDDEVNTVLMEQMFAMQPNWILLTASTGSEGIAIAVREMPELILLDMNLPDMSGADVFRRLRMNQGTCDVACVAVSADALPDQIARAEALGFQDYWTKPLNLSSTVSKLKRLLQ